MATSPTSGTQTMHYGGSYSASNYHGLSPKVSRGNTFKKTKRLETIVRLENAGIPEAASAAMLDLSVPRLRYLKKSPEYLVVRMKITHGIILDHDSSLEQIKEQRKEFLTSMLPDALQVIANVIKTPPTCYAEKKLQTAVAQDILDREGTYAKVSKTEIKPVHKFDFEDDDRESAAIIGTINANNLSAPKSQLDQITEAVRTNEAFANSTTISAIDQQEALDELEASASLSVVEDSSDPPEEK